jgi:hypothetical protein
MTINPSSIILQTAHQKDSEAVTKAVEIRFMPKINTYRLLDLPVFERSFTCSYLPIVGQPWFHCSPSFQNLLVDEMMLHPRF